MDYEKDRNGWHEFSNRLENNQRIPFFKEREIWWVSVGINIGHEEDGKGAEYSRPVLVLEKFGKYTFIGIPFSTTSKTGRYYYHVIFAKRDNTALLAQIKTFDSRRLIKRLGVLDEESFAIIRKAARDMF